MNDFDDFDSNGNDFPSDGKIDNSQTDVMPYAEPGEQYSNK